MVVGCTLSTITLLFVMCMPMQTGGMKCLVEHVKLLTSRGHTVIAVHRSGTADTAMPPWTDVKPSVDLVCRLHQRLGDVYPASKIDVVVVGIFHQVCTPHAAMPAKDLCVCKQWEQVKIAAHTQS